MRAHKKRLYPRRMKELDNGEAFVHDFRHGFVPIADGDVEAFGEEFVAGATSNEAIGELARDEIAPDEVGAFAFDLFGDDDEEQKLLH